MPTTPPGGDRKAPIAVDATYIDSNVEVGVAQTVNPGDTAFASPETSDPGPASALDAEDDSAPKRLRKWAARLRQARVTALVPGMMVGEYRVESKLGEGGMGAVYGAIHPLIGKRAAIKVLKRELCSNPEAVERFVLEARSVNQIGHPNIVDIFSFGELADGRSYFVMEWLRGESLGQRLAGAGVSFSECIEILDGVIRGLEAAHHKGIIHRDLKPDNVYLVEVRGERPGVKLLDFGIVKLIGGEENRIERTRTGTMVGTPQYMAPEQARGFAVDHRADVYSLGVMAFEMFTGRPPFQAATAMDMISKHLNDPPPKPSTLVPLPAVVDHLILDMLEKDPANRPDLSRIREILDETRSAPLNLALVGTVPEAALPEGVLRRRRRHWLGGIVLLGSAVVVAAGLVIASREDEPTSPGASMASGDERAQVLPRPLMPPSDAGVRSTASADPIQILKVPTPQNVLGAAAITISGGEPSAIEVDGAEIAPSRKLHLDLPEGRHVVAVTAPGRKPLRIELVIVAGKTITKKFALERAGRDHPVGSGKHSGSGSGASTPVNPPPEDNDEGVINPFAKRKPR